MFSIDSVSWGRGMKFASIGIREGVRIDSISLPLEPSGKVDTRTNVPLSHCRPLSISGSIEAQAIPPAGQSAVREEHNTWQRKQEKEEKLRAFQIKTQEIVKQRLRDDKDKVQKEIELKANKFNALRAYCVEKQIGVFTAGSNKISKSMELRKSTDKSINKSQISEKKIEEIVSKTSKKIVEEKVSEVKPDKIKVVKKEEQKGNSFESDKCKEEKSELSKSFKNDFSGFQKHPLNYQQISTEENFDIEQDNPPYIHYDEEIEQVPFAIKENPHLNMFPIPEENEKVEYESLEKSGKLKRDQKLDKIFDKLEFDYEDPKQYLKNEPIAHIYESKHQDLEHELSDKSSLVIESFKKTNLAYTEEPLPQMVALVLQNSRAALKAMGAHILHSLKDHETVQAQAKVTAKLRSSKDETIRQSWDMPVFDEHALQVALVRKLADIQEHHAAREMGTRAKSASARLSWGTPKVSGFAKVVERARNAALNRERNRSKSKSREASPEAKQKTHTPDRENKMRYMDVNDRNKGYMPVKLETKSRSASPKRELSNKRNQKLADKVEELATDVQETNKPNPINYSKRHLDQIKYITALKAVVRDQIKEKFTEDMPAICTCGSMNRLKNLKNPVQCANNCPFYKRQQEFQRALSEMIQSFKASQ